MLQVLHKVTHQVFAVKQFAPQLMMEREHYFTNEKYALERAAEQSVPRVPQFIRTLRSKAGSRAIVME